MAYWGSQLDVASPKDALVLVEQTCVQYTTDKIFGKRSGFDPLVKNTTEKASFEGICGCNEVEDECLRLGGSSDDTDSTVSKRTTNCNVPALFYNCDFFPDKTFVNQNEDDNVQYPTKSYRGISWNIRNYLQTHNGEPGVGQNWMLLEFVSQREADELKNRAAACGDDGSGMSEKCAEEKRALWPRAVYKEWEADQKRKPKTWDYLGMPGWGDFLSCDEFPCESKYIDQRWHLLTNGIFLSKLSQWVCAFKASLSFDNLTTDLLSEHYRAAQRR
jgi:hypothetical protein